MARPPAADEIRLGKLDGYFFDDLPQEMNARIEMALGRLRVSGVGIVPASLPEARERADYFPKLLPTSVLATLGRSRFLSNYGKLDPIVARRVLSGLDIPAYECYALEHRRQRSIQSAYQRCGSLDAFVSPTTPMFASPIEIFRDDNIAMKLAVGLSRNSQPANYLDMVAFSTPLPTLPGELPTGLQFFGPNGSEAKLLSLGVTIEALLACPKP